MTASPAPWTVLYVLNSASTGGANRSLSVLLQGLDRSRFRPLAVFPSPGPFLDRLRELEVPSHQLALPSLARLRASRMGRFKATLRNAVNVARLRDLCDRHAVALIHTNTVFPLGGALAAQLTQIPHVWHLREGLDTPQYDLRFGQRWTAGIIDSLSSRLICISEYVRRVSVREGDRERARVIYNALEEIPAEPRPRENLSQPVIGYVGLLGEKKRTRIFVEVAGQVARALPEARFLVVGRPTSGEEDVLSSCQERAQALGVADRFEWPGFVSDPDDIYHRLDLLVHPGVHEAFGRVLIEAMARGIPVVSVQSGAVAELVEDGVTGRIAPVDDVGALADAVLECLTDRDRCRKLASAARSRALERFSPDAHVQAVTGVYRELLG
jgi:glycosyltransferase involved in cell wall biosynthesis